MRRDPYNDYITRAECAHSGSLAHWITHTRIQRLLTRSGARNVASGVLNTFDDPCHEVLAMRVSFDSRAWTGLA